MKLSEKAFSLLQRDILLYAVNIITGVIIARKLGPELRGLWAIIILIPSYAEAFGRVKVDIAAVYYLNKGKYKLDEMVFHLNMLAIITSSVIIAIILAKFEYLYHLLFGQTSMDIRNLIYVILILIPVQFLYMNYSYLLISSEDVKSYNIMVIINALTFSILSIITLVVFDMGLGVVIIVSIIAPLFGLIYGIYKISSITKMKPVINFYLIKDLIKYGFNLYVGGAINHLNAYITNLVVAVYLLPAQVAYFSIAKSNGEIINKLPNSLSTILLPRIAKLNAESDIARLASKSFRVILLMLLTIGGIGYLLIKPLVLFLYGSAYLPMVFPLYIILPGLVISSSTGILTQYFMAVNRSDVLPKTAIIPLCVQVVLAFILIPGYGIHGAAVAFLVASLSLAMMQTIYFLKLSPSTSIKDLIIRMEDVELLKVFIYSQITRIVLLFDRSRK